jgi:hypothetical protein
MRSNSWRASARCCRTVGPDRKRTWDRSPARCRLLHIDQLTCRASDLARRNLLAVHPVAGWWKSKKILEEGEKEARFALVVEIDTQGIEADLYTEVQAAVASSMRPSRSLFRARC